jgi:hypothetical protein
MELMRVGSRLYILSVLLGLSLITENSNQSLGISLYEMPIAYWIFERILKQQR